VGNVAIRILVLVRGQSRSGFPRKFKIFDYFAYGWRYDFEIWSAIAVFQDSYKIDHVTRITCLFVSNSVLAWCHLHFSRKLWVLEKKEFDFIYDVWKPNLKRSYISSL